MAANFLFESGAEDDDKALQSAIAASSNPVPVASVAPTTEAVQNEGGQVAASTEQ